MRRVFFMCFFPCFFQGLVLRFFDQGLLQRRKARFVAEEIPTLRFNMSQVVTLTISIDFHWQIGPIWDGVVLLVGH